MGRSCCEAQATRCSTSHVSSASAQELELDTNEVMSNEMNESEREQMKEVIRQYAHVMAKEVIDRQIIIKGQRFFDQNAADIMLLLGFLSLPYCFYIFCIPF